MTMIGALFAGYGGLEMGVQAVLGGDLAWYSEIDKGALKILTHRHPDVPNVGDVTTADWSQVEPVDILTGGSPCQDLSHAGKRAGMTDGTRSNLWVAMREAIAQLRPGLVVWENVRGAYSAEADSGLEFCPGCMGDGRPGTVLRALGRVLGDLSDLGYDAGWHGLRAADVGAPHGRMRVFVVADPQCDAGRVGYGDGAAAALAGRLPGVEGWPAGPGEAEGGRPLDHLAGRGLLPSPRVGGQGANEVASLLPTPTSSDYKGSTSTRRQEGMDRGQLDAVIEGRVARLLPTPTAQDSASGGSTPSDVTLTDAVVRTDLGRKDNDRHVSTSEAGPREVLRDVRGANGPQEVRGETRGPDALPVAEELLAGLREHEGDSDEGRAALAGQEAQGAILPLAGGSGGVDWGPYTDAIRRWELILGRPAPLPTQLSTKGRPQLSAAFVEFLMGLPAGWVTDVPGITRNEALKALGNGVVPQQAEAALRFLLSTAVAA